MPDRCPYCGGQVEPTEVSLVLFFQTIFGLRLAKATLVRGIERLGQRAPPRARFRYVHHCLNCGYRLPAVGGSDKMGTYILVGANRTYAYLGQSEVSFANWAEAVRRGNTFSTTGPLLLFSVDGRMPGDEIRLKAGGGTLEIW